VGPAVSVRHNGRMTSPTPATCWVQPQVQVLESGSPVLVWKFARPLRSLSSGIVGGGLRLVSWVMNLTVASNYQRTDPDVHIAEVSESLALDGSGVGLMTAVDVRKHKFCEIDQAIAVATVGVGVPTWAYDHHGALLGRSSRMRNTHPGTINLVCYVNEPITDAALVNLVLTVTEAKTQALLEHGIQGTGTASDAVCILCPQGYVSSTSGDQLFVGPRSFWGARLAAATHQVVSASLVEGEPS
jgi:adenosylcobinamide hydrolase